LYTPLKIGRSFRRVPPAPANVVNLESL